MSKKKWMVAAGVLCWILLGNVCQAEIMLDPLPGEEKKGAEQGMVELCDTEGEEKRKSMKCYEIAFADLSSQKIVPLLFEGVTVEAVSVQQNQEGENISFVWDEKSWQGITGKHMLSLWRDAAAQDSTQSNGEKGVVATEKALQIAEEMLEKLPYSFGEPEFTEEAGIFYFTYPVMADEIEVVGNLLYSCPYSNEVDFLQGEYVSVSVDKKGVQSVDLYNLREITGCVEEIPAEEMLSEDEILEILDAAYAEFGIVLENTEMELVYIPMLKQGKEYAEQLILAWRVRSDGSRVALVDARKGIVYCQ